MLSIHFNFFIFLVKINQFAHEKGPVSDDRWVPLKVSSKFEFDCTWSLEVWVRERALDLKLKPPSLYSKSLPLHMNYLNFRGFYLNLTNTVNSYSYAQQ